MKEKELKSAKEVMHAILGLGDIVGRYIEGCYEEEFDLVDPMAACDIIGSDLFPKDGEFRKASIENDKVTIIMNCGKKIEICKHNKYYLDREQAEKEIIRLAALGELVMEEYHVGNYGRKKVYEKYVDLCEALEILFKTHNYMVKHRNYEIGEAYIVFDKPERDDGDIFCFIKIFVKGLVKSYKESTKKLIQTNRFRRHMEIHKRDFVVPYKRIISFLHKNQILDSFDGDFLEVVVQFPFKVGYTSLCKISDKDEIVYAKRKGRDIYSKFTLNGKKRLIDKCVVVAKRSHTVPNEYYLITLFPGEHAVKELGDKNIKTEDERKNVQEFWAEHALVFEAKNVDLQTVLYSCPYDIGA